MCINLNFYACAIIRACKMIKGEIKTGHFDPRNGMRGYLLRPFIEPAECDFKVFFISLVAPWFYCGQTANIMFDDKDVAKRDELNNKVCVEGKIHTVNSGKSSSQCQ